MSKEDKKSIPHLLNAAYYKLPEVKEAYINDICDMYFIIAEYFKGETEYAEAEMQDFSQPFNLTGGKP